jgi:quercetin dioxygenase-like cupin family protein
MAPPLTGTSLSLHPRYAQGSHPLARAGWQVLGTSRTHADCESSVIDAAMACPDYDPERNTMKKLHVCFWASLAALLMRAAVPAAAADVKELFAIDLPDSPDKEGRLIEVSYPPGAQDMVHRHDAHAFVYVLEGQIIMQLKGQPAVTLSAGQTFYEGPTDVHVVGRNASTTEPARFVVVLLKAKGAPILTPVQDQ